MESYQETNEHEVVETKYSEVFYRLVGQLENLKKRAEDPSLPEEERKKAQDAFEKWNKELEKEFITLDAMDKKEQAQRVGSQSLSASELKAEQSEQKSPGRSFVNSQGFVFDSPEGARKSEPDNDWRKAS